MNTAKAKCLGQQSLCTGKLWCRGAGQQLCGKGPRAVLGFKLNRSPWFVLAAKVPNSSWGVWTVAQPVDQRKGLYPDKGCLSDHI